MSLTQFLKVCEHTRQVKAQAVTQSAGHVRTSGGSGIPHVRRVETQCFASPMRRHGYKNGRRGPVLMCSETKQQDRDGPPKNHSNSKGTFRLKEVSKAMVVLVPSISGMVWIFS